jgi:hypothetical protein
MKRQQHKRLQLNRETLGTLEDSAFHLVWGGGEPTKTPTFSGELTCTYGGCNTNYACPTSL